MKQINNYKKNLLKKIKNADFTELEFENFKYFVKNDPVFKEAAQFYVDIKRVGKKLNEREKTEDSTTKVIPMYVEQKKGGLFIGISWQKWGIAASVVLIVGLFSLIYFRNEPTEQLALQKNCYVLEPSLGIVNNGPFFSKIYFQHVESEADTFIEYDAKNKKLIIGLTVKPTENNKIRFNNDADEKLRIVFNGKTATTQFDLIDDIDKNHPHTKLEFR